MKILALCDLHDDYSYAEILERKAKNVDLILCAGDLSVFGEGLDQAINFLDNLGKKVLCVHGNHESESSMRKRCEKTKNVVFIHETCFVFEGVMIFGYGGGGFAKEDGDFKRVTAKLEDVLVKYEPFILLTHAPPYGTKIDDMNKNYHVGSKAIRRFVEKYQPVVAVSGHIHETFKKTDKIGKTILVNPGPDGTIIEIEL